MGGRATSRLAHQGARWDSIIVTGKRFRSDRVAGKLFEAHGCGQISGDHVPLLHRHRHRVAALVWGAKATAAAVHAPGRLAFEMAAFYWFI